MEQKTSAYAYEVKTPPAMSCEDCLVMLHELDLPENVPAQQIAELALQLIDRASQTERERRQQRQAEGIAAAKARNVQFGCRPKERPTEFDIYMRMWQEKNISANRAAQALGITHQTFLRGVREE